MIRNNVLSLTIRNSNKFIPFNTDSSIKKNQKNKIINLYTNNISSIKGSKSITKYILRNEDKIKPTITTPNYKNKIKYTNPKTEKDKKIFKKKINLPSKFSPPLKRNKRSLDANDFEKRLNILFPTKSNLLNQYLKKYEKINEKRLECVLKFSDIDTNEKSSPSRENLFLKAKLSSIKKSHTLNYNKIRKNLSRNVKLYDNNTITTNYMNTNLFKKRKINRRLRGFIFKLNPFVFRIDFKDLPDGIKKLNKKYMNEVKRYTIDYFRKDFNLVDKKKFSEDYQNFLSNDCFLNDFNKEEHEQNVKIKEDIISGTKILNEINTIKNSFEELKSRNKQNKKKLDKKKLIAKFRELIVKNSSFERNIAISEVKKIEIKEKDKLEVINQQEQYKEDKRLILIKAIKTKDIKYTNDILEKFPFLLLDTDSFKYTPLHWAVKKDFYSIIPKLIISGTNANAQDFLGDTPLHYSVKNSYFECTILLLAFHASPFVKNNNGRKPFDYNNDFRMGLIFKKISYIHFKNLFSSNKFFYDNIQDEFIQFTLDEFSTFLKKDCLEVLERIKINKTLRKNHMV